MMMLRTIGGIFRELGTRLWRDKLILCATLIVLPVWIISLSERGRTPMKNGTPHGSDQPLTNDPAAAMDRLRDLTRRIIAVPKSEVLKHTPTPRPKPAPAKRRKAG
jgi:hypothetical protein